MAELELASLTSPAYLKISALSERAPIASRVQRDGNGNGVVVLEIINPVSRCPGLRQEGNVYRHLWNHAALRQEGNVYSCCVGVKPEIVKFS